MPFSSISCNVRVWRFRKKSKFLEQTAEDSLWQTMGRSIHTSVSTLFVLVAILIWGAPSIFAFIFALSFGIFIGTYSSIFVATPLLVQWIQADLEKNPVLDEDDEEGIELPDSNVTVLKA